MRQGVDVAGWLRGLGMERYGRAFRDHAVDFDVLRDLTEADLEQLGGPPRHRKKLLEAITELAPSDRATAGARDRPPISSAPESSGGS